MTFNLELHLLFIAFEQAYDAITRIYRMRQKEHPNFEGS